MNYTKRRKELQKLLKKISIDALLITDFYNILYLTGFQTLSPQEKEAKLIVIQDIAYFITDTRYESEARIYFQDIEDMKIVIHGPEKTLIQIMSEIFSKHDIRKLSFEKHDLSYAWYEYLNKSFPNTDLLATTNSVMNLRNIKDEKELSLMRKAAGYTSECLEHILPYLKTGVHESEIIYRMEDWIRKRKLHFSFEPIVAFDEHSALPHYNNKLSDGVLSEKSIILIDMGITYKNYCSDITRMLFFGNPSNVQQQAYDDLLDIQKKTIKSLRLGAKMEVIDSVARNGLTDKGYPSIPHSTGHGVGLEVHEGVRVAKAVTDLLQSNTVLTIEPGIYHAGKWGMRIEDTVAVVDGKTEILTTFPKELTVL